MTHRALPFALVVAFVPAASVLAAPGGERVEAIQARVELPESQLLDVAIDVFAPGTDDTDPQALTKRNIRVAVRKSEARYIPIHLRNTLQSTGQWGAVRVVPGGAPWAELSVSGRILKSNGKDLEIAIRAWDATGQEWLEKTYKQRADTLAYAKERVDGLDPFQSLYNRIANDLVEERQDRSKDLARVREVARLRFAADMAPASFASYLSVDKKGRARAERLPAADDPMLGRIAGVRDRDQMLVDTLNEYYADFYGRMDKPYDDWRAYSYEEQLAYDSINRAALLKKILGAAAVLGGLLMDPNNDHGTKDVLVIGGIAAIQSGFEDDKEKGIHKAALTELVDSLDGDVRTLLVDVDGKVTQLKGSAEAQFAQWRELLRQIASTDAVLPSDINVMPAPPPSPVEVLPADAAPPAPKPDGGSPPPPPESVRS